MDPNNPFFAIQAVAERIILDPRYHDLLTIAKSARNGAVYGTKVRFPHALVYGLCAPEIADYQEC